jgi:hypothetical protein
MVGMRYLMFLEDVFFSHEDKSDKFKSITLFSVFGSSRVVVEAYKNKTILLKVNNFIFL